MASVAMVVAAVTSQCRGMDPATPVVRSPWRAMRATGAMAETQPWALAAMVAILVARRPAAMVP